MNLLVPFTILVVSWSIDNADPYVHHIIMRIFYAVHGLLLALMLYMFALIWRRGDKTIIKSKDAYTNEPTTSKAWEYDVAKLRELFLTKIGMAAVISALVASRFGIPFPLLLQCLNNPKAVYESELFRIYILHKPEEGSLARPWSEASLLPEWMKAMWEQGGKESEVMLKRSEGATTSTKGGSKHKKA